MYRLAFLAYWTLASLASWAIAGRADARAWCAFWMLGAVMATGLEG
jgi:hypothetical protein